MDVLVNVIVFVSAFARNASHFRTHCCEGQLQMDVHKYWEQACTTLNIPTDVSTEFWDIISTRYSEYQRFYHTIEHIKDMFNHFENVHKQLEQPDLVAMAIIFHDVIYEPKERDNEEKSAELFEKFVQSAVKEMKPEDGEALKNKSKTVIDWILATKTHKTQVHTTPNTYGHSDLDYFLDMDMAILAKSPQDYKKYASEIRREYCHYEEGEYRQGRASVLKSFLKIPNIYATKIFRDKFESQARSNVETEIGNLLQSQV